MSDRETSPYQRIAELERENAALRAQKNLQGLHLATMADVVLGEHAADRSDEKLVREVCHMAREYDALRADKERLDWIQDHGVTLRSWRAAIDRAREGKA